MACRTCMHWKPKKAGIMAKFFMAPCELGEGWRYLSPHFHCTNHQEAEKRVVEARAAWIGYGETK